MSRDACELPSLVLQMSELKMETTPKVMDEQEYLIVSSAERSAFLHSFLKTHSTKKVIVFLSSSYSIEFHSVLLKLVDVECYALHWRQNECERTSSLAKLYESEKRIFLCIENVVLGVDISSVDWIIHYDPPSKVYIDKVICQTACREETKRKALIFLIPQEIKFLQFLEEHNVKVKEFKCSEEMLANAKLFMENLEMKKFYRNKSSRDAYMLYVLTYHSHPLKIAFNSHHLDLQVVGASFGLSNPPKLNLEVDNYAASKSWKRRTQKVEGRKKKFSSYARQR